MANKKKAPAVAVKPVKHSHTEEVPEAYTAQQEKLAHNAKYAKKHRDEETHEEQVLAAEAKKAARKKDRETN